MAGCHLLFFYWNYLFRRPLVLCFVAAALWWAGPVAAQSAPDSLEGIGQRFAQYGQRMPLEKIFAHLDRPSYVSGETMWFKLYVVAGTTPQPLASSTVAYVEVLNPQQTPVLQAAIALHDATGQGSLVLPPELPSGRYTVRAYTSWMKNFGPEYYFHSTVTILNTRTPLGLMASRPAPRLDAQFFPEGGYLVQGLTSKVGFKITDSSGQSLDATGTVLDQVGSVMAKFSTLRYGMGSFSFTPTKAGAAYRAVLKLANQQTVTYNLPAVQEQGYVLRLEDTNTEQLRVVVQAQGEARTSEKLYLLGHARHQVTVAAAGQLQNGQTVFSVPKRQLLAGVSHFTLFNSRRQPVCERLYFRPPSDTFALSARTNKPQYTAREKVTLHLTATQAANLSVAVYQLDSLSAQAGPDLTSYLWLSADVKGRIENPAYYLKAANSQAADNLMLTQGWRRFSWTNVLTDSTTRPVYPPELHGHLMRGRVVNSSTGAPVAGQMVYLTAPSRFPQLYNALSQTDGSILVEVPDWHGAKQLIAQTDTRQSSAHRVEIFSPFSSHFADSQLAPLVLPAGVAPSLLRRHVQAQVQQQYPPSSPAAYRLPGTDSLPFYGKPTEQYLLDKYTRFKTLEDVMREYVPGVLVRARKDGFHFLIPDQKLRTTMENPLVLLDGMPVFDVNRIMAFDPLKIRQLDVVTSRYVVGPAIHEGLISYTTYSGDLAGFPPDPQALLQEYTGLQGQRDFYAPRYDTPAAAKSRLPDFRNLLYWNPQATATAAHELTLSFYTSDQLGSYRVVVQGLSREGTTGSTSFTFQVKVVQ
ncbi:hypothetical protein J0X19_14750 [Hymenobacter sp. BT186]|uniref:Macroglobulin domain-containing protein n=1 Tax=Hymenobacter telluris TaxID=2816474 RepID=A0A939JDS4_9BACT|nr:hypothetical protein [Hymenobacter telluris]MBO0359218.1 hypothetical protein [Hymenobacter telluris]MBW3375244.1 hypothetical protein [Hymenobacter norwichensis]